MQPRERKKESKNFDPFACISTLIQQRLSDFDFGFCSDSGSDSGFGSGFDFGFCFGFDSDSDFGSGSGFDFDCDFPWFTSPCV